MKNRTTAIACAVLTLTFAGTTPALAADIDGTDGPDVLAGTNHDDTIRARGGDDVIKNSFGNDRIFGGSGNDRILDGYGVDRIMAGPGDDVMNLHGGKGTGWDSPVVDGGSGSDIVRAGDAFSWSIYSTIRTGPGHDVVSVGEGSMEATETSVGAAPDIVRGSEGTDWVRPGRGADVIHARGGRDIITVDAYDRDSTRDVFECGPGKDVVEYSHTPRDPHDIIRHSCERVTHTQ